MSRLGQVSLLQLMFIVVVVVVVVLFSAKQTEVKVLETVAALISYQHPSFLIAKVNVKIDYEQRRAIKEISSNLVHVTTTAV